MPLSIIPAIAGAAQLIQGPDTVDPKDPLSLMAAVSLAAFDDAGPNAASVFDGIFMVRTMSHGYRNPCGDLARRLSVAPVETIYAPIGGTTPQGLLFKAATAIREGRMRAVLICGAEAAFSERQIQRSGADLGWPEKEENPFDPEPPAFTDYEMRNGIFAPSYAYAFFENAMRAHLGHDQETHRKYMGKLCERLSEIAAQNPYSWSRAALSADEITLPGPKNRMVGHPYTLRMNANIFVDQAAAVLLMSDETARSLGISSDRLVYPLSGAALQNVRMVSKRPLLHDAPALSAAAKLAFSGAGCGTGDIAHFDFYSCFPWAVEAAMLELGVSHDDPRPISLTGGLPYFGGPGNNYSLHAVAEATERIRRDPKSLALVTSLGWYNTRWAVGIYGGEPLKDGWTAPDTACAQGLIDDSALPDAVEKAEGDLLVESLVVLHDRTGEAEHATALGRLKDGRRAFARAERADVDLDSWEKTELIGTTMKVKHDPETGYNRLIP